MWDYAMKTIGWWFFWSIVMTIVMMANYTFAQDQSQSVYQPFVQWDADAIWSIHIEFCNTWENIQVVNEKELSIITEPNKEKKLCFRLQNIGDRPYSFGINFVDGLYNNMGNKSCDLEEVNSKFGQYVYDYDSLILLTWWEIREIHPTVTLPATSIGKFLWCMTLRPYIRNQSSDTKAGWMDIIVRRWVAISVRNKWVVQTLLKVTSSIISPLGKLKLSHQAFTIHYVWDRNYTIQLWLINSWAVSEDITVKSSVTDTIWRTQTLGTKSAKMVAGKSEVVAFTTKIPWYRMRFTVHTQVIHTPDIAWIPSEYIQWVKETQTINIAGTFFVFPWRLVVVIVCIVVLILYSKQYKKKRKTKRELETRIKTSIQNQPQYTHPISQ